MAEKNLPAQIQGLNMEEEEVVEEDENKEEWPPGVKRAGKYPCIGCKKELGGIV